MIIVGPVVYRSGHVPFTDESGVRFPVGLPTLILTIMLNELIEYYQDEEFLIADGFNDAIIGVDESSMRIIYSEKKCIYILMSQGMTQEDAIEFFDFNVRGSYVGEQTPIWCSDFF